MRNLSTADLLDLALQQQLKEDATYGTPDATECNCLEVPSVPMEVYEGFTEEDDREFVAVCGLINTLQDRIATIMSKYEARTGFSK